MCQRQFIRSYAVLAFVLGWLLPATNASAQKTANRFEDLSGILKPGDRVTVVMTDGTSIKARMVEVTAVSMVITDEYKSGHGIEGEFQRTVQSDLNSNPCVKVAAGSQTGNCAGSAMEGVESQLVGTGRLVYSIRSRFQPFISGGFSFLQTVERDAFAVTVSGSPQLFQTHFRFTDYAAPVGGGLRVPLTH
jgi:hypothetical protein